MSKGARGLSCRTIVGTVAAIVARTTAMEDFVVQVAADLRQRMSLFAVLGLFVERGRPRQVVHEDLYVASLSGAELLRCLEPIDRIHWLDMDACRTLGEEWAEAVSKPQAGALLLPMQCTAPEVVGVLVLGLNDSRALAFDVWQTVSHTTGLGLDCMCLRQRLKWQERTSQALYDISRAFVSTIDLDDLLDLIVRSAVDTIDGADNCVLHLWDPEAGMLRPRALSFLEGRLSSAAESGGMRLGEGVAGMSLKTGRVINIPNVSQDPRFVHRTWRPIVSIMSAPLHLGDHLIGTLSVDSLEPDAFGADDERLLVTLAAQAAAAIENARLVHDLQRTLRDLRAAQRRLVQSEKLSAIGQLIAGITHELNNPLAAVMGYAQLLQLNEGLSDEVQHDLARIHAQAQRASKIVQNLLVFARQQKSERQVVDVNDLIERAIDLQAYRLRVENIDVNLDLDDRSLCVMADPYQIQQVFLNLIHNAQDAMTEYRGRGTLTISSCLCDGFVQVRVIDDGPGLSEEVQQHLFEPFFTTKDVGHGTGLGLSICYGIVTDHGGRIWAESEEGQGATFVVELPAVELPAESGQEQEAEVPQLQGCRVLVVEDEEPVALVLERVLRRTGNAVVHVWDGEEALKVLAEACEAGRSFDLLVVDVKMPGMDGVQLYAHIKDKDAALARRILFVTGDTMSPSTKEFLERTGLPYLAKPFTLQQLETALTSVAYTLGKTGGSQSDPGVSGD